MNERRLAAARELIEALRAPACYAHPVRFVEVRETHVSWVLLTGTLEERVELAERVTDQALRLGSQFGAPL